MAEYKLTKKALQDLSGIWTYTAENWSERQADRYYHLLIKGFKTLAKQPDRGIVYDHVASGLFGFKVSRHIIFYRIRVDQPTLIIRILHEQMDLESRLAE